MTIFSRVPARLAPGAFVIATALLNTAPARSDTPLAAQAVDAQPQSVPAPESEGSTMNAALAAMSATELAARLHSVNQAEIQMSELAKQRSPRGDVKALALEMQQDHNMVDQKLQAVVAEMKLSLQEPQPVNAEERLHMQSERDALAKLQGLQGTAFDRLFLNTLIDAHQRTIQMASIGHGSLQPSPLRNLLEEIIPSLRSHLDRAMNIQKSLPTE